MIDQANHIRQEKLCFMNSQKCHNHRDKLRITKDQLSRQVTYHNKLQFLNSRLQDERNELFKSTFNFKNKSFKELIIIDILILYLFGSNLS